MYIKCKNICPKDSDWYSNGTCYGVVCSALWRVVRHTIPLFSHSFCHLWRRIVIYRKWNHTKSHLLSTKLDKTKCRDLIFSHSHHTLQSASIDTDSTRCPRTVLNQATNCLPITLTGWHHKPYQAGNHNHEPKNSVQSNHTIASDPMPSVAYTT